MAKTNPKRIRERLGLSEEVMARALGVTPVTVWRWETRVSEPQGTALAILRGVEQALDEGADPKRVAGKFALGVGALIFHQLTGSVTTEVNE